MKQQTVYLRPLEITDADRFTEWHNDPALYEYLVGNYRPVRRADVDEWLRRRLANDRHEVNRAICLAETGEHIGNIYLRDIDWLAKRAELHIFLGDAVHRAKGYGRTAVQLLRVYAFDELHLQRIYLFVLEDNVQAIRVYEKCGFELEGRLRRHAFKDGMYRNVIVMGLCATQSSDLKEMPQPIRVDSPGGAQ